MGASGPAGGAADVRPMVPDDARGLSELVVRCYGDTYPKRLMYRPDELAGVVRSGAYLGVVAVAEDEVVGHIGCSWPTPEAGVVEAGTTVVDPRSRGRGLMGSLALELGRRLAADGVAGFIHFPTTAHAVMQSASLAAGGRETGIMLAYLPSDTRDLATSGSSGDRLAVTVVYQPILEAPEQGIHLPHRHAEWILGVADALGLQRSVAGAPAAPVGESCLQRGVDTFRGLERVSVKRIGADIEKQVSSVLADTSAGLVHVDLPMSDPAIDPAVERLRRLGFAFAAWLPGWAGHDVLRLQRIEHPTERELAPSLVSAEAEALMSVIRTELPGIA